MVRPLHTPPKKQTSSGCWSTCSAPSGRWRKRKGIAKIRLQDGSVRAAEIHWYEAHGIGSKEHKIKRLLPGEARRFVVCISNDGHTASLEPRKIYVLVADADAEALGMLRVIDESGEDYLFPRTLFADIDLTSELVEALAV